MQSKAFYKTVSFFYIRIVDILCLETVFRGQNLTNKVNPRTERTYKYNCRKHRYMYLNKAERAN